MTAFSLIQTTNYEPLGLKWVTLITVLAITCIATRFISGAQSRPLAQNGRESRRPKTAPYWIPWLGHGISFLWNHLTFLESLRDSTRESIFGVYLRGETYQAVVSPSMMKAILSSKSTSSSPLQNQALTNVFGDPNSARNARSVQHHPSNPDISVTINREPFISEASKAMTQTLQRNVPNFVSFSRSPVDQSQWERDADVSAPEEGQSICEASLFALTRAFVGQNLSSFLMGEAFVENFPLFLTDLWTLDKNLVPLFIGLRRWIPTTPGISAAFPARDRLLNTMSVFYRAFNAWDDGIDPGVELRDLDDISDLVKERMRTFRKLDLSPTASAVGHLSLYWDVVEYSSKMTFWTIAHIFADSALLREIREEISTTVKASRRTRQETGFPFDEPPRLELDMEDMLQHCPLLKACYYESIRLHSAGISLRKLETDMTLTESTDEAVQPRTYKLSKGEIAMIPHGLVNCDSQRVSNPDQFDPLRFIVTDESSGAKRASSAGLEPFSDGLYGPKNNPFTERAVLASAASIISMWNITSANGLELRVPNNRTTWGTFQPATDVKVKIKLRV
ncbi:hypothetical protein PDE_02389 [Penicillium oxalicum 114-2]|uniref:Cytochrome P450 n=1 Tax=Penicillium oxalicum (strain 114-2 / CGMCC 5302) TaxID=933388 RepID=S7ZFL5_PENO1|nr:hypothetical protein PDE_02389 [Penicillium oxalicum 114-2]